MRLPVRCLALIATLAAIPAHAAVLDTAPTGFTVKHSVSVHASAAEAYRQFTRIGAWWDSQHTYSGKSANLAIDARANGCFCEKIASGGGITHMTVVYADAGKVLRMTGGLGPLQSMAVSGVLTLTFASAEDSTRVEMVYTVGGYSPQGFEGIATGVDQVLVEQMNRYQRFANAEKP